MAAGWLSDPDAVAAIDEFVRAHLATHRRLDRLHQAPGTVAVRQLVESVRTLGSDERWYWATIALCLLVELIFAAELGTPKPGDGVSAYERERTLRGISHLLTPVLHVRNALLHPASVKPGDDTFVEVLIDWLDENSEGALADLLRQSWAHVAEPDLALFVLLRVNGTGPILRRLTGQGA